MLKLPELVTDESIIENLMGSKLWLLWCSMRKYLESEIARLFPGTEIGVDIYARNDNFGGFFKIMLDIGADTLYIVGLSLELENTKKRTTIGESKKCRNCIVVHPGFNYLRQPEDVIEFLSLPLDTHSKLFKRICRELELKQSNNKKKKKQK